MVPTSHVGFKDGTRGPSAVNSPADDMPDCAPSRDTPESDRLNRAHAQLSRFRRACRRQMSADGQNCGAAGEGCVIRSHCIAECVRLPYGQGQLRKTL